MRLHLASPPRPARRGVHDDRSGRFGLDGLEGEALWTLNYLQVMHGGYEDAVDESRRPRVSSVGIPGNDVVGGVLPGVFLGSSDIEGFQAGDVHQSPLDN